MQEWAEDIHFLCSEYEFFGCCLVCEAASPGCLCFDCKCRKCYWYSPPEGDDWKGHCDLAKKRRQQKDAKV